jgi:hypothetical protein
LNKILISTMFLAMTAAASAATVESAPLQKAPFDTKKPLFINNAGGFACPDGFDLFVRAVKPELKKGDKEIPGDYESFYFAKTNNPAQPAIIVSRPGINEYVPACLAVK